MFLKVTDQLSETAKNVGDTSSLGGVLLYMINALNPYLEFIIVAATAVWFILRTVDLAWNLIDRFKGKEKGTN